MAERVRFRAPEIRQAILDRLHGMEEDSPVRDVEYLQGLREAVAGGVDYGVALLAERPRPPVALLAQARLAARNSIPLETVIRRYYAGKMLFVDFLFEEASIGGHDHTLLRSAVAAQEEAFDQLISLVTEEYNREKQSRNGSHESQLADRVRRLLAGELVDPSCLDYDLNRHHLGVVAGPTDARRIIRQLARETDSRALIVNAPHGEVWAWLGKKEPFDLTAICRSVARACSPSTPIAIGESAQSQAGWRLTHRQARAAFSIAKASPGGLARYADVAMIVSAARDPLLMLSFQQLFLLPLQKERDGGSVLRKTLRAYFAADRNSSSAGAALKVTRQTVLNRIRLVEKRLDQPLSMCGDAVDAALRMEELGLLDPYLDIV